MDFLFELFAEYDERDAIASNDKVYSYRDLLSEIEKWRDRLENLGVKDLSVVSIFADFSFNSISLFFALIQKKCILVPLSSAIGPKLEEYLELAQTEHLFDLENFEPSKSYQKREALPKHRLYKELRVVNESGLVVFSSGTDGKPKCVLHKIDLLLNKFKIKRHAKRILSFLLFDHLGGINTMLYALSNGGFCVTIKKRTPHEAFRLIEKYKVELLPSSPTFLNLILLAEPYREFNSSSLTMISYGTEPMLSSTLERLVKIFPDVNLLQTYGLSELGVLRSKSKENNSLWFKVGGAEFKTRIIDGILQIKSESAMLGYLNDIPSPFTSDGWYITGDCVECDGDFIRILGRSSDIINVGGQKVYPAEVESCIGQFDEVSDVTVYGEKNLIMGNIVCADLELSKNVNDPKVVCKIIKDKLRMQLDSFKVPVRINIIDHHVYSLRYKKIRRKQTTIEDIET